MSELSWEALYDLVQRHGAQVGADLCAIAGADAESGRDPDVAPGDNGRSWGLWQMRQGAGLGGNHTSGELRDPDFAARIMIPLYNQHYADGITLGYSGEDLVRYTCMEAERPEGYPDYYCPAANRYVASWHAAMEALMPDETPHFDPNTPAERQRQDWVCSIRTVTWMLHSIGRWIDAGTLEDYMVGAGLVSPALGLLDGSGQALATWLTEFSGYPCHAEWVDWDTLYSLAGTQPIGIGGVGLNHWMGVRGPDGEYAVAVANPAPNWQNIGDSLSQAEFDRYGPWAMLTLQLPPDQPPEEDVLSAEERAELDRLRSDNASYVQDTFVPIAATLDQLIAQAPPKAAILRKLEEVRNSIRQNVGV